MQLRPARPADLGALVPLVTAFYAEGGFTTPADELRRNLDTLLRLDSARVAAAELDGDLIGFAVTTTGFDLEQGPIAELSDLYVVPDRRRNGIGESLVTDSATWAESRGCRALDLVVAASAGNPTALIAYYTRHHFHDEDRHLLTRRLPTNLR